MRPIHQVLGVAVAVLSAVAPACASKVQRTVSQPCQHANDTVYEYVAQDIWSNRDIPLFTYWGKIIIVVNVATYCAFTNHYLSLNALQTKYREHLIVLGFPCNQFGLQEPGANATEIMNGIRYIRPGNNFQPNFQMSIKIDVNGDNEHPLFTYLKRYCPTTRDGFESKDMLFYRPLKNNDIRWNWEKILIDRSGRPVVRYDASTDPEVIEKDILNQIKLG